MPAPEKKVYDLDVARDKIQRYCAYQERSQKEVITKLKSYGLLPLAADELLIELMQQNFLNEERFAKAFARGKFNIKGWGTRKIQQELWRHGVSKPCIALAMAEITEDDYNEKLNKLFLKKWESLSDPKPKRVQKVIRYLLGRGYLYEEIKGVIEKNDL